MTDTKRLPDELKKEGLFCVWRREPRNGRQTKIPYNPKTRGRAQSTNPSTFAPLHVAEAAQGGYNGIGVGIFGDICAVDIDHCVNAAGLSELARDVISIMNSYTEYSPSGKGIRILFKAPGFVYDKSRFYINNQKSGLEVYVAGATNKYVTVTGNSLNISTNLEERGEALQIILDRYMRRPQQEKQPPQVLELFSEAHSDEQLIRKAQQSRNGALFGALYNGDISRYPSHSEADQAFCNMLAFWTGQNPEQMERIFRQSGLMRDKVNKHKTYLGDTIKKAINDCRGVYNPQEYFKKKLTEIFPQEDPINERVTKPKRTIADLHPENNERYGWHDMGNGYLFADWYKGIARYVPERKKWFVYGGKVWRADTGDLKVMELCKNLADNLMIYALTLDDEDLKKKYMNHAGRWQRRSYRETVIKDAQSVYPISATQFDTNPNLFNCLNGTLDLQTGDFRSHSPEDLLSKLAGVNFNPQAKSERWERFVNEVMEGDRERVIFLQKSLGYALTGDTRHECFFILYGPKTRNGKGTCMETFLTLTGDYGKTASPDTVTQKQKANGSGASDDVARLAGARFVNISEPDKKMVLNASFVKTLTGRDTIPARFLYEGSFEFKPQFKLFMNTNYLPAVTDATLFESGRVKIIPFERRFEAWEQDRNLKDELTKPNSLSGILNWCLRGLQLIDAAGFDAPDSVRDATEEYRHSSDKIARFFEDEFEQDLLAETRTSDAYTRYKNWCRQNGFFPENSANFKTLISKTVLVVRKRPAAGGEKTTLIRGYRLIPDFMPFNGYG